MRLRDWLLPVCMIFMMVLALVSLFYGLHIGSPDGTIFILVGGALEMVGVIYVFITSRSNKNKNRSNLHLQDEASVSKSMKGKDTNNQC